MTQIAFRYEDAHKALDQFLAETQHGGERIERWIGTEGAKGEYGEPVAYLVPAKAMHQMQAGYSEWLESQEVCEDAANADHYQPWHHSPLATTDRLLPTEPLEGPLARAMTGKPYAELPEDEQWRVKAHAINLLLRVQLDPDGQGAVPVMMVGHDADEPGESLRWQIAFTTPVPGLYVRATGNGFFGEDWGVVTGSGYQIASGWYSREEVTRCAEALGRVLPNCDWMRLTPSGFTPRAKEAIAAVIKKYRFAADESAPEPEVMADAVPEAQAGEAATASTK
jgi:hypothetical protein